MKSISGAFAISETLKEYKAEIIFGFIGHSTHEVADAIADSGIRVINPATELGGAYMVNAYNYLRNAPAAVGIWHTVGSLLILPALQEATSSRIPSVHLGLNADSRLAHRDGLQQVPLASFTPVTRFSARVERLDKVGEVVHRAFQASQGFPAGATYIDIPFDITADRGDSFVPRNWQAPRLRVAPSADDVSETIDRLRAAKRPLVLVGGGAVRSDAGAAISGLIEALGIPFVTTTTAQGIISEAHPLALGTAGMVGWTSANSAMAEADLLLVLGSRLSDWGIAQGFTSKLPPEMIQVDLDVARLGEFYFPSLAVVADVRDFVTALTDALPDKLNIDEYRADRDSYRATAVERKAQWLGLVDAAAQDDQFPINPWRVMSELRGIMTEDDILVSDIGNHSSWSLQGIVMHKPRRVLLSFGEGILGTAIPMGIGAKLAEPEATVFVATGDGAAQYHLNELRVAIEHDAPVVILLFNNGQYGANEQMMLGKFGRASWTSFRNPDYVQIARAYGGDGERLEHASQIGAALARAKASGKAYVIDIPTPVTAPYIYNLATGPLFMASGRDMPTDVSGTLAAGEHRAVPESVS